MQWGVYTYAYMYMLICVVLWSYFQRRFLMMFAL
jgi:hypothetical protein